MRRIAWALFVCVCILFSAIFTVLTLVYQIKLTAVNSELNTMNKEIEALTEENRMLESGMDSGLGLDDIYNYATGVLGMQNPEPGQIFYIELLP